MGGLGRGRLGGAAPVCHKHTHTHTHTHTHVHTAEIQASPDLWGENFLCLQRPGLSTSTSNVNATHCTHGPDGPTHGPHTVLMVLFVVLLMVLLIVLHTVLMVFLVVLLIVHKLYSWSFSWSYSSFTHWTHGPTHGPTCGPHTVLAKLYSPHCTHGPTAYTVLMWSYSWVLHVVHPLHSSSTFCTHGPTHGLTHRPHTVLMWSYSCGPTHVVLLMVHTLSSCGPTHGSYSWSTRCPHRPHSVLMILHTALMAHVYGWPELAMCAL